jgi:hypothetical protein
MELSKEPRTEEALASPCNSHQEGSPFFPAHFNWVSPILTAREAIWIIGRNLSIRGYKSKTNLLVFNLFNLLPGAIAKIRMPDSACKSSRYQGFSRADPGFFFLRNLTMRKWLTFSVPAWVNRQRYLACIRFSTPGMAPLIAATSSDHPQVALVEEIAVHQLYDPEKQLDEVCLSAPRIPKISYIEG